MVIIGDAVADADLSRSVPLSRAFQPEIDLIAAEAAAA